MAQAVEQAQKQRELSKEALAADLDRFEAKVRSELDVKARLRRDGLRIAALAGGALLLVGGLVLLRARLRRRHEADELDPATIEDLATELREIRKELEKQRKGGSGAQKLLLRGLTAAGSAGGTYAARQMLKRQKGGAEEKEEARAG